MSRCLLAFCFFFFANPPLAANETRTKQDLAEIQKEIERSEIRYKEQSTALRRVQTQLQRVERSVAEHVRALAFTNQSISENNQQQQVLIEEHKQLNNQKQVLTSMLGKQVKSAYLNGSHDYSKMLLNQENAAKLERMIVYYTYLNNARINQIEALKKVVVAIDNNQAALRDKQAKLDDLAKEQNRRLVGLRDAQQEQIEKTNQLKHTLESTKTAIAYLRDNEKNLRDTLAQLHTEKVQQKQYQSLLGLNNMKGNLPWPVTGRLANRFGARKDSGLNWNGLLIEANEGTNVTSIRQGQVVYADWLNGYGWVIVVDHGEGFMSLYGHAQTLLRDVGDVVQSGEPIAKVGQSGGQQNPGLYFEIRHKGRAVNPIEWCRRS
ncbi:hypothetical protein PALB_8050 [Pseudoalteromonas luteoviolacea B = ATCC 29581]|nr:hypothetical protein PALB_8050 [Pseudoalteromonas luteoviolacea B = ATCC 29581]